jgi:hypothetical protein
MNSGAWNKQLYKDTITSFMGARRLLVNQGKLIELHLADKLDRKTETDLLEKIVEDASATANHARACLCVLAVEAAKPTTPVFSKPLELDFSPRPAIAPAKPPKTPRTGRPPKPITVEESTEATMSLKHEPVAVPIVIDEPKAPVVTDEPPPVVIDQPVDEAEPVEAEPEEAAQEPVEPTEAAQEPVEPTEAELDAIRELAEPTDVPAQTERV